MIPICVSSWSSRAPDETMSAKFFLRRAIVTMTARRAPSGERLLLRFDADPPTLEEDGLRLFITVTVHRAGAPVEAVCGGGERPLAVRWTGPPPTWLVVCVALVSSQRASCERWPDASVELDCGAAFRVSRAALASRSTVLDALFRRDAGPSYRLGQVSAPAFRMFLDVCSDELVLATGAPGSADPDVLLDVLRLAHRLCMPWLAEVFALLLERACPRLPPAAVARAFCAANLLGLRNLAAAAAGELRAHMAAHAPDQEPSWCAELERADVVLLLRALCERPDAAAQCGQAKRTRLA
jgi:hypothetical protein